MKFWHNLSLFPKVAIILISIIISISLFAGSLHRQHQHELVIREAITKARLIAFAAIRSREYLSNELKIANVELTEDRYGLIPVVASNRIGTLIGEDVGYSIRQVSNRFRNPTNKPDTFETVGLKDLENNRSRQEFYQLVSDTEGPVFRYLQPFSASESCLECHGDPEKAPALIKELYPQESDNAYNYKLGEVIGAVSISMPLTHLQAQIAENTKKDIGVAIAIILILTILIGLVLKIAVTGPISQLCRSMREIMSTGQFGTSIEREGDDEIGQLISSFNEMQATLQLKRTELTDSERRYRLLTETAHDPIISFLPTGQVILFNRSAGALLGYGKGEALGMSLEQLLHEEWQDLHEAGIETYLKLEAERLMKETPVIPLRRRDGKKIEVQLMLSEAEGADASFFTAILHRKDEVKG